MFLQPASFLFKFSQWADIGQHVPREYCTYVSVSGKNVTVFQAKVCVYVCVCVCVSECIKFSLLRVAIHTIFRNLKYIETKMSSY